MREHEYFVYIMSSRSGTLYIGITNSIYRRALEHRQGEIEGFASKIRLHKARLLRRIRRHSQGNRSREATEGLDAGKEIALIKSKNPRWEDLAEKWGARMLFAGESMKSAK